MDQFSGTEQDLIVRPDIDLADLTQDFINYRKNDILQAKTAVATGDYSFLRRLGHTIKGVARPYGFIYLETISKNLEKAAEKESLTECQVTINEMDFYINNVQVLAVSQ